jgi:transcription antitermination factor NusG
LGLSIDARDIKGRSPLVMLPTPETSLRIYGSDAAVSSVEPAAQPERLWHAVWTRPKAEESVADHLTGLGIDTFLPKTLIWKSYGSARRRRPQPLFPGYVFVHHALDRETHAEVVRGRGVVRVLGDGWDRLAVIPASEMERLRAMVATGAPISTLSAIPEGSPVRVVAGPLMGLTGVFQRTRRRSGLLVASITLLRRSVAVEVDAAFVEPL